MIGTRFCKHSLSITIIFKLALSKFPLFIGFGKDQKRYCMVLDDNKTVTGFDLKTAACLR